MSITNALSNALSGLNATTRAAGVVSSNVANAMTEGYGRREIELGTRQVGGQASGVSVVSVHRVTDPVIMGERRLSDGLVALESTRVDYHDTISRALGQADDSGSITGLIVDLETSIIEAANHPESDAHLYEVSNSASALADKINRAADMISSVRQNADRDISNTVDRLQSALSKVVKMNVEIQENVSSGYDASGLIDQRQTIIDEISKIIPVKEVERENGMVSLYSPGGAILVSSKAATLDFTPIGKITPDMTLDPGILSGLTINGQPVSTRADKGPIAGGQLAGLFEIRDTLAPEAQTKLDAFTRDLMIRFEDPSMDPTLAVGMAGLFTDNNAPFDAAEELGLSNRISVNAAVDPKSGGELWRLRDGLGATSEGDAGDASLLQAMLANLQSGIATVSGGFSAIERSSSSLSSDLFSFFETASLASESDLSFASAQQATLKSIELENGVDTDQELQKLLVIERSYAANAKVIETVEALFDQLMRI
ncbi:flagellar hook-associated protein FlgK [Celeribacter marinus]|uniref:flagellar hook-associated protein FlgK n=1 Tax=Celeribacter marinus TaxID=1397108 RepID=UPI003F6D0404